MVAWWPIFTVICALLLVLHCRHLLGVLFRPNPIAESSSNNGSNCLRRRDVNYAVEIVRRRLKMMSWIRQHLRHRTRRRRSLPRRNKKTVTVLTTLMIVLPFSANGGRGRRQSRPFVPSIINRSHLTTTHSN